MKLTALMPVRNEAWVLGLSARVALLWCDELVILNHASMDRSAEIIREVSADNPGRVWPLLCDGLQWDEMRQRQLMLDFARDRQATHIAIVDADEVLTGSIGSQFFDIRATLPTGAMLQLPGYNLRGSLNRYHANGTWGKRWFSTAFKDNERFRWWPTDRGGETYHKREGFGPKLSDYRPIAQCRGGTMHLWGASDRRLTAKHALYKMIERIRGAKSITDIDREYSWWKTGCDPKTEPHTWQFADVPTEWWEPYKNLLQYLDLHAAPWQEAECKRLIGLHGRDKFKGLDLFGVVL